MRKLKTLSVALTLAFCAVTSHASTGPDDRQGGLFDKRIHHAPVDGVVRIYGPNGPHIGLLKVAEAFEKKTGKKVEITHGPESGWTMQAQGKADIIYAASHQSMSAYLENYHFITEKDVQAVYLRNAVFVVKKGNPKGIKNFGDIVKEGVKVVVTEGKGVYNTSGTGLWEDIAGRTGSLKNIQDLHNNIVAFSKGSGAAFTAFQYRGDVWITWKDWAIAHKDRVDYVDVSKNRAIYRSLSLAVSPKADPLAKEFVTFLNSDRGARIMENHGWTR